MWLTASSIAVTVLLLASGLALAYLGRRFIAGLSEISTIGLVVLPTIIFGLHSNLFSEVSGFGISAKFKEAGRIQAREIKDVAAQHTLNVSPRSKGFSSVALFQECADYFVLDEEGRSSSKSPTLIEQAGIISTAIKSALLCEQFLGIVVVDKRNKFIGFFPRSRFENVASYPLFRYCNFGSEYCEVEQQLDIKKVLVDTELGPILHAPGVRADSDEATKFVVRDSDALTAIVARPDFSNARVFAVVDNSGRFIGLLTKQAIYDRLLAVLFN